MGLHERGGKERERERKRPQQFHRPKQTAVSLSLTTTICHNNCSGLVCARERERERERDERRKRDRETHLSTLSAKLKSESYVSIHLLRFSGSPSNTESRSTINIQLRKCAENIIKKISNIVTSVLTVPDVSHCNTICISIFTFLPGKQFT